MKALVQKKPATSTVPMKATTKPTSPNGPETSDWFAYSPTSPRGNSTPVTIISTE
jgi:hypothetical protein